MSPAPPPADPLSAPAGVARELAIENSIEIYKITADWIRFADAKAAVVLGVAGTLGGVLIPHLSPYLKLYNESKVHPALGVLTLACFFVWLALVVLSAVWAFRCIVPLREKGKHPALDYCKHFHGAAISVAYERGEVHRFAENHKRLGPDGLMQEVMAGILIDAHISSRKYAHVTASIKLFFASALFGFLFLLLSQFSTP
ncbi:MAG: hypothetical protein K2W96_03820 [Gemmataceae bacterium]|nr:hypothetical protein [Gemmataceae bacterium]